MTKHMNRTTSLQNLDFFLTRRIDSNGELFSAYIVKSYIIGYVWRYPTLNDGGNLNSWPDISNHSRYQFSRFLYYVPDLEDTHDICHLKIM